MAERNKINTKYIYEDFKDFSEIDEIVRLQNMNRIFTGSVRINNGMYRTKKESDLYVKKSLSRKLP